MPFGESSNSIISASFPTTSLCFHSDDTNTEMMFGERRALKLVHSTGGVVGGIDLVGVVVDLVGDGNGGVIFL